MKKFFALLLVLLCLPAALGAQQNLPPAHAPYYDFMQGIKLQGSWGSIGDCLISNGNGQGWGACLGGVPGLTSDGANGIIVQGKVAANSIGAAVQADQQPGTDFGQKILNCLATAKARGTYFCDARGLTGSQELTADLHFTTTNANSMTIVLGANVSVNQHGYQVLVDPGVIGFAVLGSNPWATSTGGCANGGALFFYDYTATKNGWEVSGTESATPLTRYIHFADFGICILGGGAGASSSASGLYLGANVQDVALDRLRVILPASSNPTTQLPDSTGSSLKLWGGATSAVHSAMLVINGVELSGGAGVTVDGNGAVANWGQVFVYHSRIQATKMTWGTTGLGLLTFANAGSGCTAGDVLTVAQGANTTGRVTINFVDGSGVITGASVTTDGTGYSLASSVPTTGGTCTVQPQVNILNLGVLNRLRAYGGDLPTGTQVCVTVKAGEFSMNGVDLESCDGGLRTLVSSGTYPFIRPDGCCVKVGVIFDGSGAYANNVNTSPVHGGTDSGVSINAARANHVTNGVQFVTDVKGNMTFAPYGNVDANFNFICGAQALTVRSCNIYWGDAFSGVTRNKWQDQMDTSYNRRWIDLGAAAIGATGTRMLMQPATLSGGVISGQSAIMGANGDAITANFSAGNPFALYHPLDSTMNILLSAGATADQQICFNVNTYLGFARALQCFNTDGSMNYNHAVSFPSLTLTTPLAQASGGNGSATPGITAGAGCTVTGSWPNQVVACAGTGATAYQTFTCPISISGSGSFCSWTLPAAFTFTKYEFSSNSTPACTAFPTVQIVNRGSSNTLIGDLTMALSASSFLTQNSTATATSGTIISVRITTPGSSCSATSPTIAVTGHY